MDSALLSTAPLAALAVVVALLARATVLRWYAERSGRVYELPTDYRPVVFRAAAALLVLVTAIGYAIQLPHTGTRPSTASAADASGRHPAAVSRPADRPAHPVPRPVPRPAPRQPRTVAHPADGTLQELPDGTRVWLPAQYDRSGDQPLPLVAAYLPDDRDGERLYAALAGSVAHGLADPMIVVRPRDCATEPSTALDAAARHYRTARGRAARAVIGLGNRAQCAVRAELSHPERYRAAAGVSGTYGAAVPRPAPGARPRLLLAAAVDEARQRASGLRLRAALRRSGVRARFLDEVARDPALGGDARRHLLALVSGYLTEELHPHAYRHRHPYRHRHRHPHRHRLAYGRRRHRFTRMAVLRDSWPRAARYTR